MTRKSYRILSLVVNLYFSWALAAETEIISLEQGRDGYEGTEDTSIYSENENSNGGGVYLFSGRNAQLNDRRTLIRFDLARVPEGALLLDVTLTLYVSMAATPRTGPSRVVHNLHRITNDWTAGSVVADTTGFGSSPGGTGKPADVGDATWISNRHQISEWDQEGGDFEGVVSATTQVGMTGELAVWSSAEMLNDIRSWLEAPGAETHRPAQHGGPREMQFARYKDDRFVQRLVVPLVALADKDAEETTLLWDLHRSHRSVGIRLETINPLRHTIPDPHRE